MCYSFTDLSMTVTAETEVYYLEPGCNYCVFVVNSSDNVSACVLLVFGGETSKTKVETSGNLSIIVMMGKYFALCEQA